MLAKLNALVLGLALIALATTQVVAQETPSAPAAAHADDGHAGGDHGHHDHIGTANAGPNLEKPEEIRSDLAFFTFVVFLVLLAILWKFAWGPIIQALEAREQAVADHIAQAERNHEQAKLLLAQYEQKLADAANEVRALMEEARREAEHTKQSILAEAKAGAEAEKARALRDIEAATDTAMETLAQRSAQLAVDLAGKIVRAQLTQADHAKLIQDAIGKFPAAAPGQN